MCDFNLLLIVTVVGLIIFRLVVFRLLSVSEGGFDFGFLALAIVMFELFLFASVCVEMCFFGCLSCFCLRECVSRSVFCGMCCTCCGVGFWPTV